MLNLTLMPDRVTEAI